MILLDSCFLFEVFDGVRNSEQLLLNVFISALIDSMIEVGSKIRMYFAYGEVHKNKISTRVEIRLGSHEIQY